MADAGNEVNEGNTEVKPRGVVLSNKVRLVTSLNGEEMVWTPHRNFLEIAVILKDMDRDTQVVELSQVEDKEASDALEEGKERYKASMLPADIKLPASRDEVLSYLLSNIVPERNVVQEFQKLCEFMSIYGTLKGMALTLEFAGHGNGPDIPVGFTFYSGVHDIGEAEYKVLGDAIREQLDGFRKAAKERYPRIMFEGETGIIVPR